MVSVCKWLAPRLVPSALILAIPMTVSESSRIASAGREESAPEVEGTRAPGDVAGRVVNDELLAVDRAAQQADRAGVAQHAKGRLLAGAGANHAAGEVGNIESHNHACAVNQTRVADAYRCGEQRGGAIEL